MLVLARKLLESIVVGEGKDAVIITVVDIRGDKARLGVTAPKHVPVNRQEVAEAKAREKAREQSEAAT